MGERVEALQRKVEEVYEGMPEMNEGIAQCLDLEKKLHRKRTAILQVGEKIQFLLGMKDDFLKSFQLLDNVKTMEKAACGLSFQGEAHHLFQFHPLSFSRDPLLRFIPPGPRRYPFYHRRGHEPVHPGGTGGAKAAGSARVM